MPDEQVAEEGSEVVEGGSSDIAASFKDEIAGLKSQLEETTAKLEESSKRGDLLDDRYVKYLESLETGTGKSASAEVGDDFDPEEATRAQLLAHLKKQRGTEYQALKNELAGGIDDLRRSIVQARVQDDLDRAIERHPDLNLDDKEYKKHFHAVASENPTWKAEKVYKQVKMERNEANREKTEAELAKAESDRNLATEKGGLSDSVAQLKDLTADEAGEDAWRRVMGNKETIGPA